MKLTDFAIDVNLGHSTPEPSLYKIIYGYYAKHFDYAKSHELTVAYINKLLEMSC